MKRAGLFARALALAMLFGLLAGLASRRPKGSGSGSANPSLPMGGSSPLSVSAESESRLYIPPAPSDADEAARATEVAVEEEEEEESSDFWDAPPPGNDPLAPARRAMEANGRPPAAGPLRLVATGRGRGAAGTSESVGGARPGMRAASAPPGTGRSAAAGEVQRPSGGEPQRASGNTGAGKRPSAGSGPPVRVAYGHGGGVVSQQAAAPSALGGGASLGGGLGASAALKGSGAAASAAAGGGSGGGGGGGSAASGSGPGSEAGEVQKLAEVSGAGAGKDAATYLESMFAAMPKADRELILEQCDRNDVCDPVEACRAAGLLARCEEACRKSSTCRGTINFGGGGGGGVAGGGGPAAPAGGGATIVAVSNGAPFQWPAPQQQLTVDPSYWESEAWTRSFFTTLWSGLRSEAEIEATIQADLSLREAAKAGQTTPAVVDTTNTFEASTQPPGPGGGDLPAPPPAPEEPAETVGGDLP